MGDSGIAMPWVGQVWRRGGHFLQLSQALGSWGSLRPREGGPLPITHPCLCTYKLCEDRLSGSRARCCRARWVGLRVQAGGVGVVGSVTHLAAWPGLSPLASVFMT